MRKIEAYLEPGSSIANKTGEWRQGQKPFVKDNCRECGMCISYCPEGAIYTGMDLTRMLSANLGKLSYALPGGKEAFSSKPAELVKGKPWINYDYCKGCGICETETAPTENEKNRCGAIEMVPESSEIAQGELNDGYKHLADLFAPGHSSCAGCGNALAIRYVLNAVAHSEKGANAVVATGCSEIFSSIYPLSSWKIPFIHSLFQNSAAVASGVEAAIKMDGKNEKVIVFAGDGGTADIGFQALSGMIERGHDVLYIMIDNEAYMNTGIQRSSSTPLCAWTTTSETGEAIPGKLEKKKPLLDIIAAHGGVWAATASLAEPFDLMAKVFHFYDVVKGPGFIQIHAPCPRGWRFGTGEAIKIARKAIETGLWVQYLVNAEGDTSITKDMDPSKLADVSDYLKTQGRFGHLAKANPGLTKEIGNEARKNLEKIILRSSNSKFK